MKCTQIRRLFEPTPKEGLRCRHAITGLAPASKLCGNWYECGTCEYDQMLEDTASTQEATFHAPAATHIAA